MTYKYKKKIIVGLDEVGRGALSGPVVAAAVTVWQTQNQSAGRRIRIKNLKDSKKLTFQRREEIYKILINPPTSGPQIKWGIGRVSEKVIDKINILEATKLAMEKAVKNLEKKIAKNVDYLMIDGNFGIGLSIPQKSVIKGDEKIFLIKLASIIAKVTRDRAMLRYHKKYLQYRFDKHKGYGTRLHIEMLKKFGPCKIHRKTFNPVKSS